MRHLPHGRGLTKIQGSTGSSRAGAGSFRSRASTCRAACAKAIRRGGFEIRIDHGFEAVIRACAAPTPGRPRTWLNETLIGLYVELARDGFAHSVEVWRDGELAGGLYGLALGGAFFGESMFSRVRDSSKIALVDLVGSLRAGGFVLLDAQFLTAHLRALRCRRDQPHRLSAHDCAWRSSQTPASRWATIRRRTAPPRRSPAGAGAAEAPAPAARRIRSARHRRPGARGRRATGWRRTSSP